MQSTILMEKKPIKDIQKAKDYPRQTYNGILRKMRDLYILFKGVPVSTANIHSLQKSKMSQLWNSKEDEVWDEIESRRCRANSYREWKGKYQ